ncbi:MAG: STAS domain-containing protein [Bacteroidota bacterium]|nr:STAS domain-containing protein [Bacteroidota bacterium]MDP4230214.1 STAS domain-containing protein [Bacteroidota bacterium]MDP4235767.1 STAS domain-containing protein [Bacteroidota bacterium]
MQLPIPSQFTATEAEAPTAGITLIELSGQLDAHTAPDFERFLEERVRNEKKAKLILDFSALGYISSAGLGVLMGLIEEVRAQSGDMKLIKVPEKIYHVLDLLGFPIVFEVLPNLDDALVSFSKVK